MSLSRKGVLGQGLEFRVTGLGFGKWLCRSCTATFGFGIRSCFVWSGIMWSVERGALCLRLGLGLHLRPGEVKGSRLPVLHSISGSVT